VQEVITEKKLDNGEVVVKTEKVEQDLKERGEYITSKKTDVEVTTNIAG
jgi:hypothetical protein